MSIDYRKKIISCSILFTFYDLVIFMCIPIGETRFYLWKNDFWKLESSFIFVVFKRGNKIKNETLKWLICRKKKISTRKSEFKALDQVIYWKGTIE